MFIEGTRANSREENQMEAVVDLGGDGVDSQLSITNAPEGLDGASNRSTNKKLHVEMMDSRPKKPSGPELIRENVKELYEVIAYMDYSFERAFTIQEKEFMLAYKVTTTIF